MFQFQLMLNSSCSSVKASFFYWSSADTTTTVFSARCATLCLFFAFIYFNHKSHKQPQVRPSTARCRCGSSFIVMGVSGGVSPQTKLHAPKN